MKTGRTEAGVAIMLMPMVMAFAIIVVKKDFVMGGKVKTSIRVVAEVEMQLAEENVVNRVKIE
jgi:hypothetical protein